MFLDFLKNFHIGDFIKKWFTGGVTDDLKKYGTYSVTFLQHLKDAANNPAVTSIEEAIPGDWDNKLVETFKTILSKVIAKDIAAVNCLNAGSQMQQFVCFFEMVESHDKATRTAKWTTVAFQIGVELFNAFVGKQFDYKQLLVMIPIIYTKLFGKQ